MRTLMTMGLLLIATCDGSVAPNELAQEDVVIRWGTSFGMCVGYCVEGLEVVQTVVRLTRRGWVPSQPPALVEEQPLGEADRRALLQRLESVRIESLQEVYGCPDCADGGSEWVELETNGSRKRV